jgi:transcription elongation factor Elf1
MSTNHNDRPPDEIMGMANRVIGEYAAKGMKASVNFKFTCRHCGERCTFVDQNMLYAYGECHACGKETKIEKAGFMLLVEM